MKDLENLTKEELVQVIALKTEMLIEEDEETVDIANLDEVCEFIGFMGRFPEGYAIPEFRSVIERAYECYVSDYGMEAEEMAELIGINAEELNELVATMITDVEDAEEMGWFDE